MEELNELLFIIFTDKDWGGIVWFGAYPVGTAEMDYMQSPQRPQMRYDRRADKKRRAGVSSYYKWR